MYLDPFDHFVKETLRVRAYCRYCDDFALFAEDPRELADWREACRERLAALRLRLHPRKSVIYRTQDGPRFLGFRVFPTHRLLAKENVTRMRRRLVRMQRDYAAGRLTPAEVEQRLASWIGHASHGDTWRLREQLFADHPFVRGPA